MAEVRSREEKPLPGIDYSEIHIPDEENLGTGSFTTLFDPKAMVKVNPLMSTIVNKPVFQLIMSVNAAEYEATVLLGKADNTPADSRKVYKIPKDADTDKALTFKAVFSEWNITALEMDGTALKEAI